MATRLAMFICACVLLAGCGGSERDSSDTRDGSVRTGDRIPNSDADPKQASMAHVHGIGRNPGDGDVYVATHNGLWQAREGRDPKLVGGYLHDFMGFSVVGPDHFIASGHPNSADALPPHLGLIESKDAGRTWTSRSLLGEADFHALRTVGDTTYGWNSQDGALMSSADGSKWDTLIAGMMMLDLAVEPTKQQTLIASVPESQTELKLQRSTDGGASFEPVKNAPQIARFAWHERTKLWGFDVAGRVWASKDEGRTWERVGDVKALPDAVWAADDELLAAAGGSVLRSIDGGRTWDELLSYDG